MKEIELTRELKALVDDEDFEWLNQWKWYANKMGNTFYAIRALPWKNGKRVMLRMHHVIIGYPAKGFMTDHADGNGCNNQRENLRHVTRRQNQQNRKNKISKYPGITWFPECKKWRARIQTDDVRKHLGLFSDEQEAFEAYRDAVHNLGETMIGELV